MDMEHMGYGGAGQLLDRTFAALADPTRRAILGRLARGEAAVIELTAPFTISQPAISKHLRVLERAGLITRAQDAQRRPRRLAAAPLGEASRWLDQYRQFWEPSFARLDGLLDELKAGRSVQAAPKLAPQRPAAVRARRRRGTPAKGGAR
jgi:DNA-binding transcriptional ArsR family regulator